MFQILNADILSTLLMRVVRVRIPTSPMGWFWMIMVFLTIAVSMFTEKIFSDEKLQKYSKVFLYIVAVIFAIFSISADAKA